MFFLKFLKSLTILIFVAIKVFIINFSNKLVEKNELVNLSFSKTDQGSCINFKNKYQYLYIFAYSISLEDNLEIKLYENNKLLIYKYYKYVSIYFC